ncbi:MAG: sugar phosphate isomerase/epimerase [Defluviitaleaceae bacterium]|nr:sugar phosphate isomerase/epimerase [Defluviitaleaceae bacterium]
MKIGVRAHDFGRYSSLTQQAQDIKNAGFECVQYAPAKAIEGITTFDAITQEILPEIKSAFSHHNVEIAVLGCYIEPSLPDKEQRLNNVRIFSDNLSHAKHLGVPIVGTETTRLATDAPAEEREAAYQRLKDSVLRMAETAEKENVLIGIEPVASHTLNTPALTRRLLDEVNSPKLKVIFDPVNLVLPETIHNQDQIFKAMFSLLGNEIEVMHIKDTSVENGKLTWQKIGQGAINYPLIFDWLKKNKPNICLLREDAKMDSYHEDITAMKKLIKG